MHTMGHTLPPLSTPPNSTPPFGFTDAGSTIQPSARLAQSVALPWQQALPDHRQLDRLPLTQPPIVRASSCWGPPRQSNPSGVASSDHSRPKVKLEPPRFDGTEVNNWIRGVQFYFDHVGTPEAQHLHYVVMLFEPFVAYWIWNYCASHEFVTWYGFLDDVRRCFDPHCYVSHVGLLKKLQQTELFLNIN